MNNNNNKFYTDIRDVNALVRCRRKYLWLCLPKEVLTGVILAAMAGYDEVADQEAPSTPLPTRLPTAPVSKVNSVDVLK